jgi:hypothetical protein
MMQPETPPTQCTANARRCLEMATANAARNHLYQLREVQTAVFWLCAAVDQLARRYELEELLRQTRDILGSLPATIPDASVETNDHLSYLHQRLTEVVEALPADGEAPGLDLP